MDMGSATCENSSATMPEPLADKDHGSLPSSNSINFNRPNFYPCTTCGRKFTVRALAVHRKSCTESADCCCSACKSQSSDNTETKTSNVLNDSLCGSQFISDDDNVCLPEVGNTVELSTSTEPDSQTLMEVSLLLSQSSAFSVGNFSSDSSTAIPSECNPVSTNYLIIDQNNQHVSASPSSASRGLLLLHEAASLLALSNVKLESLENNTTTNGNFSDSSSKAQQFIEQDESLQAVDDEKVNIINRKKINVISGLSSTCPLASHKLHCNVCNLEFPWEIYGSHVIQHSVTSDDQCLKCPTCLKPFTRSAMLLIHFYKHITDQPFVCKDCRMLFRLCDDLKNHTLKKHGYVETRPYHCYICMRRFSHPQTIINHMRLHSKETPFKCNVCSRSFSQIGNLQRHFSVHRGDRPHKCQDCDKSFADPATLRNHVRIHTGETPFVCKVCARGFSQIGNLKRHMARHLQTKPKNLLAAFNKTHRNHHTLSLPEVNVEEEIQVSESSVFVQSNETDCTEISNVHEMNFTSNKCNGTTDQDNKGKGAKSRFGVRNFRESTMAKETAVALSQLKEQRKRHHWQLFNCPVCGKVYTWQHDLSIHFRIHTGEKPYSCDLCDKRFAQSGAVRIHKARHHNISNGS